MTDTQRERPNAAVVNPDGSIAWRLLNNRETNR